MKILLLKMRVDSIFNRAKTSCNVLRITYILGMATLIVSSCGKELNDPVSNSITSVSSDNSRKSLTVDAGPGRKVVYPDDNSTKLFGNGSGESIDYRWEQISGKPGATIERPNDKNTDVSGLRPGVYMFSLTATDKDGNSASDTTSVTVLEKMTWTIEGTVREALVHIPDSSDQAPVLFAFHGHGGTDLGFAEKGFELEWPQAVVIYPQGLLTTGNGDTDGKKTGWQHDTGEVNNHTKVKDQDLKFFDAMLSTFENEYHVNSHQVFVHGWSNGGSFIYDVLWSTHGDKLCAISSAAAILHETEGKNALPTMHIAGKFDPLVKFDDAQASADEIRNLNQCVSTAIPWGIQENGISGTRYWSPLHDPLVFLEYDGGHDYPSDVPHLVVRFFKMVARNETD